MSRNFIPKPSIIDSPRFNLGESPVWWVERNLFVFTDILDNRICLFDPFSFTTEIIKTTEPVVCIAPCNEQVLLLTYHAKICTFNIETNTINDLFVSKETELGIRFNDGKCDQLGRFWVSRGSSAVLGGLGLHLGSAGGPPAPRGLLFPKHLVQSRSPPWRWRPRGRRGWRRG